MSDPFETLRKLESAPAAPLPAAEVRRRGDRMRHRRTALHAVGAAAALLVVVTGGALAGGGTPGSAPAPGPATQDGSPTAAASPTTTDPTRTARPKPATMIPAGFPLDHGLPEPSGDVDVKTGTVLMTPFVFDPCRGTVAVPAQERTDFAEVRASIVGGSAEVHQLAVYPDDGAAHRAFAAFGDALDRCPSHDFGNGSVDEAAAYGPAVPDTDESLVVVAHGTQDGLVTTLASHYVLARVGNAVLVTLADGEFGATRSQVASVDSDQRADAAALVAQMCAFRDDGCAASGTTLSRDGYGSLKIGMSAQEVADSPEVRTFAKATRAACRAGTLVDGGGFYWSKAVGLVAIWAGGRMQTAEGIHLGSSEDDVRAAYPDGGYDVHRYWTVPLGADMELQVAMPDGTVEELMLTGVNQDCFD